jgi:hypothetical protein
VCTSRRVEPIADRAPSSSRDAGRGRRSGFFSPVSSLASRRFGCARDGDEDEDEDDDYDDGDE